MTEEFKIKTEVFEGPLELLLSLIEKRKLLINDISLSKVADDFIEYIQSKNDFPIDSAAHFILIASTLLLIKSKSLLPTLQLSDEEQVSIDDLERRLRFYKTFKELSVKIGNLFGKKIIFNRPALKNIKPVFSPDPSINAQKILESANDIIQSFPKKEKLPKAIVQKIISLEEMIDKLTTRIQTNLKFSFSEFVKSQGKTMAKGSMHKVDKEGRLNIIVGFLAMLELVKQGIVSVTQNSHTEDIEIETKALGVPNYHS